MTRDRSDPRPAVSFDPVSGKQGFGEVDPDLVELGVRGQMLAMVCLGGFDQG